MQQKGGIMQIRSDEITATIDIGTTKICVIIAHAPTPGDWTILGVGHARSRGVEYGCVVHVEEAVTAIQEAVHSAEQQAGISIKAAYIGISGSHTSAYHSRGSCTISKGRITQRDVHRALYSAKQLSFAEGERILHTIPQSYIIDEQYAVHNPVGMHATHLEVDTHIITGGVTFVYNLITCCQYAGIQAKDIVLEPLASGDAVLSKDEQALGVGLLDIGGGTSDCAVYYRGTIQHTRVFPIGGTLFTHDIAICLQTSLQEAERLKREYGHIVKEQEDTECVVTSVDDRTKHTISTRALRDVIYARTHELISLFRDELKHHIPRHITLSGIVITGGGSQLYGLDELATSMLGIPCRIGTPEQHHTIPTILNTPEYATSYGLLTYALQHKDVSLDRMSGSLTQRIIRKMKSWLFTSRYQ